MSAALPLRAAAIGLGAIGRHHARILAELEGVRLVAACDARPERADEHARLRGCAAVVSPADLPEDLDVAVVATPTVSHRAVAEPLLRRGVACLVEKPLAGSLEDADALITAARDGRATLMVGHAERFNPGLARVRESISSPRFVEAHRLGVFPERSLDVDVVLDLMIHDLDLLLWLTGGEVESISAVGLAVLTDRVDIANARVELSTGCTANVTASRVSTDVTRKLRIFQDDSYVSVDFMEQRAEVIRLAAPAGDGSRPAFARDQVGPAPTCPPKEEPLRHELLAFLRAVRGEQPVSPSGAEGRKALAAALAVKASMESHRLRLAGLPAGRRDARG